MKHVIFILAWLCALVSTGLAQERLRVVTTTGDLRSLVKSVGAERVVVSSLVPTGERAESYQPRLNDVAILKGARVVVRAAIGIDPWFDKVLARAAQKNGRTGIERGEPGHLDASASVAANDPLGVSAAFRRGRRDSRAGSSPHYWLDPKTADAITADILKTFVAFDPANKSYYENNRRTFLSRLDSKVGEWQARLAPLAGEPLIAFHDDWAYFANRFRLNIIDYITIRDGAPPKLGPHRAARQARQGQGRAPDPGRVQPAGTARQYPGGAHRRQGRESGRDGRRITEYRRLHRDVRGQCERAGRRPPEEIDPAAFFV